MDFSATWFGIFLGLAQLAFFIFFLNYFIQFPLGKLNESEKVDKESQAELEDDLSRWKLLVANASTELSNSMFLIPLVVMGLPFILTAVLSATLALLWHGTLIQPNWVLAWVISINLSLGFIVSCIGIRLWKTIKGDFAARPLGSSWLRQCFLQVAIVVYVDILFWCHGLKWDFISPYAVYSHYIVTFFSFSIMATTTGIEVGAINLYSAFKIQDETAAPSENQYAPRAHRFAAAFLLAWIAILEVNPIIYMLEHLNSYGIFGRLFFAILHAVIFSAEISAAIVCNFLSFGFWNWWWEVFFATGLTGLVVFLKSIAIVVLDIGIIWELECMLAFLCMLITTLAVMLSMGAVGVLTGFLLVRRMFSVLG